MRRLSVLSLCLAACMAGAQPFTTQPIDIEVAPLPMLVPLTPQARTYLQTQLNNYVSRRGSQLPSRDSLTASGVSSENDAVEQAWLENGRRVSPHHYGRATATTEPTTKIDPAALEGARANARRRVGRQPTPAEVSAELAAFDARVAALNRTLASQRSQMAARYKQTGAFRKDFETTLLGLPPREPQMDAPTLNTSAHLQNLLARLVNVTAATEPISVIVVPSTTGPISSPR